MPEPWRRRRFGAESSVRTFPGRFVATGVCWDVGVGGAEGGGGGEEETEAAAEGEGEGDGEGGVGA